MLILAERDEREMWHIKYVGEMHKTLTLKTWWEERSRRRWQDNIKLDVKEEWGEMWHIKYVGEMRKTLTLKTWWEESNRRRWQDNIKLDVK